MNQKSLTGSAVVTAVSAVVVPILVAGGLTLALAVTFAFAVSLAHDDQLTLTVTAEDWRR